MIVLPTNHVKSGFRVENSFLTDTTTNNAFKRVATSAGSTTKGTVSFWYKPVAQGSERCLFKAHAGSLDSSFEIQTLENTIRLVGWDGTRTFNLQPTRLFLDPSAWFHIVAHCDTTQATASDRLSIYINGVKETIFTTSDYPVQNLTVGFGSTATFAVVNNDSTYYNDVYVAEFAVITGSEVDVNQFGEWHPDCPEIWRPKNI